MNDGITRYDVMPIPPVEAHTRCSSTPARCCFGVEYRLLTDAIAAAARPGAARSGDVSARRDRSFDDRGVSIHVYGVRRPRAPAEYLRFDCFDEDPHYHYVSWKAMTNEMIHIDPVAEGDPLSLDPRACMRTRLPQMLARAGAEERWPGDVDARAARRGVLPRVAEAAYRARFHHDDEADAARRARPGRDGS